MQKHNNGKTRRLNALVSVLMAFVLVVGLSPIGQVRAESGGYVAVDVGANMAADDAAPNADTGAQPDGVDAAASGLTPGGAAGDGGGAASSSPWTEEPARESGAPESSGACGVA